MRISNLITKLRADGTQRQSAMHSVRSQKDSSINPIILHRHYHLSTSQSYHPNRTDHHLTLIPHRIPLIDHNLMKLEGTLLLLRLPPHHTCNINWFRTTTTLALVVLIKVSSFTFYARLP